MMAVCSSSAFLRLERCLLRWRRTAIKTITVDMLQTVWNEVDYRVDVCKSHKGYIYRAPVRYVTKTWSFALLNKKNIYSYLRCIVYDKLLKPRQLFLITLYYIKVNNGRVIAMQVPPPLKG